MRSAALYALVTFMGANGAIDANKQGGDLTLHRKGLLLVSISIRMPRVPSSALEHGLKVENIDSVSQGGG